MRQIGEMVWTARLKHREFHETCPDCLGTKAVTLLLENGDRHSLDCGTCYPGGYEKSRGYVVRTQYHPAAEQREIIRVDASLERTNYGFYDWSCDEVFDTEDEAIAAAEKLRAEKEEDDHKRFAWKKEDSRRTWWWSCGYYRQQIKRAKQELAYAEARLNVAKIKAKEPESAALAAAEGK